MKRIKLSQGKFALVDDEDFKRISMFEWYAAKNRHTWYARRSINKTRYIGMHHEVMRTSSSVQHDHKNGNGLDNRKDNLRPCNHSQNRMNCRKIKGTTSKYKGVSFNKKDKRWCVTIGLNNRHFFVGNFTDEKEAALAYNKAAKVHFSDRAKLNIIHS